MEMKKKLFSVFNNGSVAWRIFSYSAAVLVFVLAVWTGGAAGLHRRFTRR